MLKYAYAGLKFTYWDLDLPLLVAGEMAILLKGGLSAEENAGRLELLQAAAYHSKAFDWRSVQDFHRTVLSEVETGDRQWGGRDTWLAVEASTLYVKSTSRTQPPPQVPSPAPPRGQAQAPVSAGSAGQGMGVRRGPGSGSGRRWFCKPYQTRQCNHRGTHDAKMFGRHCIVEHMCATCWLKEAVVRSHPESSDECPFRSETRA